MPMNVRSETNGIIEIQSMQFPNVKVFIILAAIRGKEIEPIRFPILFEIPLHSDPSEETSCKVIPDSIHFSIKSFLSKIDGVSLEPFDISTFKRIVHKF